MALILPYACLDPSIPGLSHWFFQVSYVSDVQDWTQPSTLFTAIFEIYNLVSVIQRDRIELRNMKDRIVLLNSVLSKKFKETFMSRKTHTDTGEDDTNPPKRARTSHGGQGDNTANVLRRGDHVYDDRQ